MATSNDITARLKLDSKQWNSAIAMVSTGLNASLASAKSATVGVVSHLDLARIAAAQLAASGGQIATSFATAANSVKHVNVAAAAVPTEQVERFDSIWIRNRGTLDGVAARLVGLNRFRATNSAQPLTDGLNTATRAAAGTRSAMQDIDAAGSRSDMAAPVNRLAAANLQAATNSATLQNQLTATRDSANRLATVRGFAAPFEQAGTAATNLNTIVARGDVAAGLAAAARESGQLVRLTDQATAAARPLALTYRQAADNAATIGQNLSRLRPVVTVRPVVPEMPTVTPTVDGSGVAAFTREVTSANKGVRRLQSDLTRAARDSQRLTAAGLVTQYSDAAKAASRLNATAARGDVVNSVEMARRKWTDTRNAIDRSGQATSNIVRLTDQATGRTTGLAASWQRIATESSMAAKNVNSLATAPTISVRPVVSVGPNLGAQVGNVPVRVTPQIDSTGINGFQSAVRSSMTGLTSALSGVRGAIDSNRQSMNLWRSAMQAAPVDQRFNVAANGINVAGATIVGTLGNIRKAADAMVSDPGKAATALQGSAGAISSQLQDTANTMAKWLVAARDFRPVIQGMGVDFDALEKKLQTYQTGMQGAANAAAAGVSKISAAAAATTGQFQNAVGSSTIANYVEREISRPARLGVRALINLKAAKDGIRTAAAYVASPVNRLRDLWTENAQAVRLFRQRLETLDPAARRSALRMHHLNSVVRPLRVTFGILTSPIRLLGRQALPVLTSAATAVTGRLQKAGAAARRFASDLTSPVATVRNLTSAVAMAGRGLSRMATTATAAGGKVRSALAGTESTTNRLQAGVDGVTNRFRSMRTALFAVAAASLFMGIKTAAATETAEVGFGTIYRDLEQGRAVVKEITKFSAATPFAKADLTATARLLAAAQTPAHELVGTMTQLGDVASGANIPIEELGRIWAQVKNTDRLDLGRINQIAERGVPIYQALQEATGANREELLRMVSAGELGFKDLEGAFAALTTGTGMFAGGMARQSQTLAGLFSTLKDNVLILFENISGAFLRIFNIKAAMTSLTSLVGFLASQVGTMEALFMVFHGVVGAVFAAIHEVGTAAWTVIFGSAQTSMTDILELVTVAGAMLTVSINEWPTVAAIAFKSIGLSALTAFNDIAFFFTDKMPALFSWFATNWREIFTDAASVVGTVFQNIGTNIRNAMTAIWDFIKSGGMSSLALSWTPLLDGFKATLSELPNIPQRQFSELELSMQSDLDSMKGRLGESMGEAVTASLDRLKKATAEREELKIKTVVTPDTGPLIPNADGAADKASRDRGPVENRAVSLRSGEGLSVLASVLRGRGLGQQSDAVIKKQQIELAAKANTILDKIERKITPLKTASFGGAT